MLTTLRQPVLSAGQNRVRRVNMKKVFWIVPVLSVFLLVNLSNAQLGRGRSPRFYSEFKPVVGGWSEYEMKVKGQPPSKMKIAVVGKEGDAYWLETVMDGGREGKMISKVLVSGNPDDSKNIKRMIVKTGNRPAMEMPVQMMSRGKPQEPAGKFIDKGMESIKVPAGTFTAQHVQYQTPEGLVDGWVYKDASPYGLVKSQTKDSEMVLTAYGTGATTLITEQPKKFEMPKMPQMPQMQAPRAPQKIQPAQPPSTNDDEDDNDDDDDEED